MNENDSRLVKKNARTGLFFLGIFVLVVGLTFAVVPFYRKFCQLTGIDGTPQIGGMPSRVLDQTVTVRFNADVAPDMPWTFRPDQQSVTLKIGQQGVTTFYAYNKSDKPISGTALYNVLPENAGLYFHKIQCFCFDAQTLQPHQEVHMPVVFYVDPSMVNDPDMKDIRTITLSYTFFKGDNVGTLISPAAP